MDSTTRSRCRLLLLPLALAAIPSCQWLAPSSTLKGGVVSTMGLPSAVSEAEEVVTQLEVTLHHIFTQTPVPKEHRILRLDCEREGDFSFSLERQTTGLFNLYLRQTVKGSASQQGQPQAYTNFTVSVFDRDDRTVSRFESSADANQYPLMLEYDLADGKPRLSGWIATPQKPRLDVAGARCRVQNGLAAAKAGDRVIARSVSTKTQNRGGSLWHHDVRAHEATFQLDRRAFDQEQQLTLLSSVLSPRVHAFPSGTPVYLLAKNANGKEVDTGLLVGYVLASEPKKIETFRVIAADQGEVRSVIDSYTLRQDQLTRVPDGVSTRFKEKLCCLAKYARECGLAFPGP